jgi:hypothetical protein
MEIPYNNIPDERAEDSSNLIPASDDFVLKCVKAAKAATGIVASSRPRYSIRKSPDEIMKFIPIRVVTSKKKYSLIFELLAGFLNQPTDWKRMMRTPIFRIFFISWTNPFVWYMPPNSVLSG